MTQRSPRWLGRNISTLLLAFILAIIVWVSAVTSADPNREQTYLIPIEVIGLASNQEITNEIPTHFSLTIEAPSSILEQINKDAATVLQAWVDLTGLSGGTHTLKIQYQIASGYRPVRVGKSSPENIEITLEELIARTFTIKTDIQGEPGLGYQAGSPTWSESEVVVSGRASLVDKIAVVEATLDISDASETLDERINLIARDQAGNVTGNISLTPAQIAVTQPITLRGGYRNMVVKVVTTGQVATGYRQTSISVNPPNVMVFSTDPALIDQLPGYVETIPLDLTDAADDLETSLSLSLPVGISVIGDPNVLVKAGIAAMEGNLKIIRVVEVIGLPPEFKAVVSPDTVDVILFGPLPLLDELAESDVRVVLDLTDLEAGLYQLTPEVIILPERIQAEALSPSSLDVEIALIEAESTP